MVRVGVGVRGVGVAVGVRVGGGTVGVTVGERVGVKDGRTIKSCPGHSTGVGARRLSAIKSAIFTP